MRKAILLVFVLLFSAGVYGQEDGIRNMRWGRDYKLHVSLNNDSSYVMDVRGLYHQRGSSPMGIKEDETTYLPVKLDQDFVNLVKSRPLSEVDSMARRTLNDTTPRPTRHYNTLWSALHYDIGGGYVHLVNCLLYALEARQLNLRHLLMERPKSDWKPDPMTESYRRTRKWKYYVPLRQKYARKEYKKRKKEKDLLDLQGIPPRFVERFAETSDRGYRKLVHQKAQHEVAQIDLVRIMLAAKYLGTEQIKFISESVRKSINRYTASNLPSVIILDDYNAAVSMRLDTAGYRVDYIVFQDDLHLMPEEMKRRKRDINRLVQTINMANKNLFRRRLEQYYH